MESKRRNATCVDRLQFWRKTHFLQLSAPVYKIWGSLTPVPIPSNFLYRICNDAAKVLHAALNTLEFTGKRACAKKAKSKKTQVFVNFDDNFLEF